MLYHSRLRPEKQNKLLLYNGNRLPQNETQITITNYAKRMQTFFERISQIFLCSPKVLLGKEKVLQAVLRLTWEENWKGEMERKRRRVKVGLKQVVINMFKTLSFQPGRSFSRGVELLLLLKLRLFHCGR